MPSKPFDESAIRAALAEFKDPETGRPITQLEQVHALRLEGDRLSVVLGLTTWAAPLWSQTRAELAEHLRRRLPGLEVGVEAVAHARKPERLGEIGLSAKTVLAVAAGKGGVGKSSVAAYLAYGLRRAGCEVGLMDADVYGPSIPHLFGVHERPQMIDDRIEPVLVDSLKVMSIGLLVPPDEAVIWRGPMLHNALAQFLRDTRWGDLDYLVIDMPPGTGDVAISLSQLVPLSGAVVVCTPQDVALLDAGKAVTMLRKVQIEVVGMVENMSYFICPDCHARHEIFGSGGGAAAGGPVERSLSRRDPPRHAAPHDGRRRPSGGLLRRTAAAAVPRIALPQAGRDPRRKPPPPSRFAAAADAGIVK